MDGLEALTADGLVDGLDGLGALTVDGLAVLAVDVDVGVGLRADGLVALTVLRESARRHKPAVYVHSARQLCSCYSDGWHIPEAGDVY